MLDFYITCRGLVRQQVMDRLVLRQRVKAVFGDEFPEGVGHEDLEIGSPLHFNYFTVPCISGTYGRSLVHIIKDM